MPAWLIDLLINIAGAFVGVLGGLQTSRWLARSETRARRAVLLDTLREQLRLLPIQPDDPLPNDRRPVGGLPASALPVSAIPHLLSGEVLDARRDAALVKQLVLLQAWLGLHSEASHMLNVGNQIERSFWSIRLDDIARGLAACRDTTLDQLDSLN